MVLHMLFSLLIYEGISMLGNRCVSKSSFNWLMNVTFILKPVYSMYSIAFVTIYNMHCTLLTWSNILWNYRKDFPLTLKIVVSK